METNGIIPTMNVGEDGFGGSGFWIFALLILVFLGNGSLFGNRQNAATQQDVATISAFNQLQSENTALASEIQRVGYDTMTSVKDVAYNNLSEIRDLQAAVNVGFANSQKCCCDIQKEILTNRYEGALNTNKIIDTINGNRIADLQAQVNELKTAQMLCGVPKVSPYFYGIYPYGYPNGTTLA